MTQPVIPIRNIYFMLAYAWNHLQDAKLVNLDAIPGNNLLDILGHVLNKSVLHLSRRGFELGYCPHTELIPGVKGRVNFTQTLRGFYLTQGKTISTFDELNPDTLANQIIKSTLSILIKHQRLNQDVREEARSIRAKMVGINEIRLSPQHFSQIKVGSNNRYYKFVISICKLIKNNTIVNQKDGSYRFYDFERDEQSMSLLYQDFLYQFCKNELKNVHTKRSYLKWDAYSESDSSLSLLPRMETDITLNHNNNTLIVDAKYYKNIFSNRKNSQKFHSTNLYQLMNYLLAFKPKQGERVSGLLLYPQVGTTVKHRYNINGFDIGLCTIDLDQEWEKIHQDLLVVFGEFLD
ncbi:5-methylcytosine-specific restriction endonuclease system specificity protein McrC [Phytobacter ursingii]|uniref:5-methylcytosine-specific restriction endonuclease system specificity protein McrC n=1 Tax=Phytobacter ursingii TaxID=1972431 RepID=A0AB35RLL8_9ENTR|nr:5-methylcytosine-specific restriction endonuclease system specificity protein McrC [Phytobacter ursingii]MDV2860972.1 5-methylcytosine-specific restriction endonuclease system specificity protein McrC [Phytobacter ursingii]